MHAPEVLRAQQFGFAAHLRDPALNPAPPAIEERRLVVYRELFFNSIRDLLSGNFPVIRRLFGEDRWSALVRDFYRDHRCQTPLFPEIAREFIRYLDDIDLPADAPWLRELAHYEWAELALDISENDPTAIEVDPDGDLIEGAPQPSPLAWALAYAWPVHRLSEDFRPMQAPDEPTFLLVQRDDDGGVRFNQITALAFRLLQRLDEAPTLSGREQLLALAGEAGAADAQAFLADGAAMLLQLKQARVVLGTRR